MKRLKLYPAAKKALQVHYNIAARIRKHVASALVDQALQVAAVVLRVCCGC